MPTCRLFYSSASLRSRVVGIRGTLGWGCCMLGAATGANVRNRYIRSCWSKRQVSVMFFQHFSKVLDVEMTLHVNCVHNDGPTPLVVLDQLQV